jgi:hypothetical protein
MVKPGAGSSSSPLDETSLPQFRDIPQLPRLRIGPFRAPSVPSRIVNGTVLPLDPTGGAGHEKNNVTPATSGGRMAAAASASGGSALPAKLPTLEDFLNAARTSDIAVDATVASISSLQPPPPKTILPAFINLRAVEKLPYASFEESGSVVKRRRLDPPGDHFASEHLQLPVPHAQNDKKPPPPFGPFAILNGLNEPPPNAALFPPIEPGSLPPILAKSMKSAEPDLTIIDKELDKQPADKREGRLAEILAPDSPDLEQADDKDLDREAGNDNVEGSFKNVLSREKSPGSDAPMSPKTRGRSRKRLRKWTDQETTDLLRGVVKCGIGNWTAILAQPELHFNKRSAANLKDRFRVCCPWAYGAADPNEATKQLQSTLANALMNAESTTSGAGGKILLPDPRPNKPADSSADPEASSGSSKMIESEPSHTQNNRTTQAPLGNATPTLSNKSKSTLVSLGVPEPYFTIKSKRRSRRPFTPAEDEALLKGYAVHGFQWTLIQQDTHLNLSHRRATDLRDRFRTKFPHAYREGGSVSGKTVGTQRTGGGSGGDVAISPGGRHREHHPSPASPPSKQPRPMLPPGLSTPPSSVEKKRKSTVPGHSEQLSNNMMLGPVSSALLPSAATSGSLDATPPGTGATAAAVYPFVLEENAGGGGGVHGDGGPPTWEDNTLPPLVWDELG